MILPLVLRKLLRPSIPPSQVRMAYHKCGHIVLAYSYGYSCHGVDLKEIESIDIHYKDDLMLVAGIISHQVDHTLFDELPGYHKKRAQVVTERLINMMMAGYLAQERAEAGELCLFHAAESLLRDLPAPIERLYHFLEGWNEEQSDPFAQSFRIKSLSYFLSRRRNWKLIDKMAKELLFSQNGSLDQPAIEKIILKKRAQGAILNPSEIYSSPEFPRDIILAR